MVPQKCVMVYYLIWGFGLECLSETLYKKKVFGFGLWKWTSCVDKMLGA